MLKNSAFIIEKCFERGDLKISENILQYLLKNHSDSIIDIIKNPFGFYATKKIKYINNKQLIKETMSIIVNSIDKINEVALRKK